MTTVFRICQAKYAASAFDGEGARLYGGCWSSRGTRIVYTAGNLALAALEMLVNLQDKDTLLKYAFVAADIPPELILPVNDFRRLLSDWSLSPSPTSIQQIGDDWARSGASAVLAVPTSVIPLERNYLLNLDHPDFGLIEIGKPKRFVFDERLLKK
ncbi:MAG: RES family NAD+ phosphorylase [Pyrinomonadaceae bacterium]